MATPDITVRFKVDAGPFIAGMERAIRAAAEFEVEQARLVETLKAGPADFLTHSRVVWTAPPPPKTRSGMTARQYRAARRRYARSLRRIWRDR